MNFFALMAVYRFLEVSRGLYTHIYIYIDEIYIERETESKIDNTVYIYIHICIYRERKRVIDTEGIYIYRERGRER